MRNDVHIYHTVRAMTALDPGAALLLLNWLALRVRALKTREHLALEPRAGELKGKMFASIRFPSSLLENNEKRKSVLDRTSKSDMEFGSRARSSSVIFTFRINNNNSRNWCLMCQRDRRHSNINSKFA